MQSALYHVRRVRLTLGDRSPDNGRMTGEDEGEPSESSFSGGGPGAGVVPLVLRKNEGKVDALSLVVRKKEEKGDVTAGVGDNGCVIGLGSGFVDVDEARVAVGGKVSAARGESLSGNCVADKTDSDAGIAATVGSAAGRLAKKLDFLDERNEPTLDASDVAREPTSDAPAMTAL